MADAPYLFNERFPRPINQWHPHAVTAGVPLHEEIPLPPLSRPDAGNDGLAFLTRFFFSCLVDADYLATESFMQPDKSELRQPWPGDVLPRMLRVLEHHSKFDPAKETASNRLSSENWDSPLIVTTKVRFFESLFANRTSACRKLHRTARSVVIFDEVQALPATLLHPILRSLRCLVHDLGSNAVLCTATQPALDRREDFPIGIPPEEITEIIRDKNQLFQTLERVVSESLGPLADEELIAHLLDHASSGCLLILNTTKTARTLFERLKPHTDALHLSARMCPAHVIAVLDEAKTLRKSGRPAVLADTQLLSQDANRLDFEHAIVRAGETSELWDKHHIVSGKACFPPHAPDCETYRFKTAAGRFRLIDSETHSVLIPWGAGGKALTEEIRDLKKLGRVPNRSHYRRAQQFTVQVYDGEWQQLKPSLSFHCEDAFAILDHPENDYHSQTGLKRPGAPCDPNDFCLKGRIRLLNPAYPPN